jgi:hypothetical protein
LLLSGVYTSLRFPFAFFEVDERNGDITTVMRAVVSIIRDMSVDRKLLLAGVAIGTTVLSLFLSERFVGPAVRAIFGTPFGFREHFFSPVAYRQALLTQAACTSIAFFTLGVALGRKFQAVPYSHAVWAANPITVFVGFCAYKALYHSMHVANYTADYESPKTLVLFSIAAPLVFASCFYAGSHLSRPSQKVPAASSDCR